MRAHLSRASLLLAVASLAAGCLGSGGGDDDDDGGDDPPAEYGPENSWPHATEDDLPDDLAGTGYRDGDIAYDFTMVDQHGDEVSLYQFYGSVVVIDNFTEW